MNIDTYGVYDGMPEVFGNDPFPFQCQTCGNCCRGVADAIPLYSYDIFHMARNMGVSMPEVIDSYGSVSYVTDDLYPYYNLKTKPVGDVCVFLRSGKCSIQDKKPITCSAFPINFAPRDQQSLRFFNVAKCRNKPAESSMTVNGWLETNVGTEPLEFLAIWFRHSEELARILGIAKKRMRELPVEQVNKDILNHQYNSYDLDSEFLMQCKLYHQILVHKLRTYLKF